MPTPPPPPPLPPRATTLLLRLWLWACCLCAPCIAQAQPEVPPPAAALVRAKMLLRHAQAIASAPLLAGDLALRAQGIATAHSPQAEQNQVVLAVEFTCARLPVCEQPREMAKLTKALGIRTGERLGAGRAVALERLLKMGVWEQVSVDVNPRPGGVAVHIRALGAPIVSDVDIVGVDPPPFREEIERLLLFREGQPWRTSPQVEKAQLASLQELYAREGYFNATISLLSHRVSEREVAVTLRIDKGRAMKLCNLGIRGLNAIDYPTARTIIVSELSLLARFLGFVEPTFTERAFRQGQEALLTQYREQGFYQARIVGKEQRPDLDTGCMSVLLDVEEGVKWRVIYRGNQAWSDADLEEDALFKQTGYVDDTTIKNEVDRIKSLYATRGYPFASVTWQVVREERYRPSLTFLIEEGPLQEVHSISIKPAQGTRRDAASIPGLGDQALLESMNTRPFGVFELGGYLQNAELLADFARIEESYARQGYHGALVEAYSLRRDLKDSNELDVVFWLREGPRSRVESTKLDLSSDPQRRPLTMEAQAQLRALLRLNAGSPYTQEQSRADTARLKQWYASHGYPMAVITTTCELADGSVTDCELPSRPASCVVRRASELEGACRWERPEGGGAGAARYRCQRLRPGSQCTELLEALEPWRQVKVRHEVDPGPCVQIQHVLLVGNVETDDDVILDEFEITSGTRFDVQDLLVGQSNLRSLGIFDSVSVEAIGLDAAAAVREESNAALLISVDEGRSQYVDFSLGIQGRDLLDTLRRRLLVLGEVQYNNTNLFGRAQSIRPRVLGAVDVLQLQNLGEETSSQSPLGVDYFTGVELVYNHPRFLKASLGIDRLLLTVAPYYLLDYLAVTTNNLQREEYGVRTELRKNLSAQVDRLFVTLGLVGKQVATRLPEAGLFTSEGLPLFSPRRTIGKMYVDVTLDRRDSPLNPSKGFFFQLSPQWVSGDALGAAGDAIDDSFLRLTASGSVYAKLGPSLIFGQGVRAGRTVPIFGRESPVPDDERYVLGGVNSLRGFPESGVFVQTPSYRNLLRGGEAVLNSNSELRYPLIKQFNVYGAMFWDVGLLADCFDDEDTTRRIGCLDDAFPPGDPLQKVRTSAGIGVRYLVADQIPLLLDYAALLNRQPGESFSYLHFNVGYTF